MPDAIDGAAWRQEAKRLERQLNAARKLALQVERLLAGMSRNEAAEKAALVNGSGGSRWLGHARLRDTLDALAAFRKATGDA
jgi:hypothetical protein